MRIDIISAVPNLLESPFAYSIVKRAIDKKKVEIVIHNLRNYAINKHGQIDDYCYGGGAGMVLRIEPIKQCISILKNERTYDAVVFMTPDAPLLTQKTSNSFSLLNNIIILCGHYKGVDQRVRDTLITHEISIGDYVLSGGELAAAVFTDSIVRLIPGVLTNEDSALSDSFQDNLLSAPVYTRPAEFNGLSVPNVLLSGNDKLIEEWRNEQSLKLTKEIRPDLLK